MIEASGLKRDNLVKIDGEICQVIESSLNKMGRGGAIVTAKVKSLKTGVATILVETQILTPISHPAIEAKLIQQASRGRVRFDVDAGRILSQQNELDRRVIGFRGQASSLHYLTSFEEKLVEPPLATAGRAGDTKWK